MTNNYAIGGRWLDRLKRLDEVVQHKQACHTFQKIKWVQIDAFLSIINKSPCSSVSLDRGLAGNWQPQQLKNILAEFVEKLESLKTPDLHFVPWSKTLIERTLCLYRDILQSCIV